MFQVLKPLRLIKNNESMQILLDALQLVLPSLVGIFILSLLLYSIFAILGVGLFMGRFDFCNCEGKWALPLNNCTDPAYNTLDKFDCIAQGGSWESPPSDFDHFFAALQSLFYCSIAEGGSIFRSGMSVTEVYRAPVQNASWYLVVRFRRVLVYRCLAQLGRYAAKLIVACADILLGVYADFKLLRRAAVLS
eukprot:SAG11_NODE_394_length_9826_cov_3.333607_5_plen_192_part_00